MSNFNSVFENEQKGTERWSYHHVCTRSKAHATRVSFMLIYILHGFKIKCNKIHHLLSKHTSSELNPRCKQRYSMKAKIKHLATCHLPNKVDENYVKCVGKVLLLLDQLSG